MTNIQNTQPTAEDKLENISKQLTLLINKVNILEMQNEEFKNEIIILQKKIKRFSKTLQHVLTNI